MSKTRTLIRGIALLAVVVASVISGCKEEAQQKKGDGKLVVVTTTGMIEDAIRNIGGERVDVRALMGAGVDPHLYKATQGDLGLLNGADVIFYNGLHLEGKMVDALEKLGRTKRVYAVADGIEPSRLRKPPEFDGNYDPHIWFDVKLWSEGLRRVVVGLKEADPEGADLYERNAAAYFAKLDSLDAWVRSEIATVPKEYRVLVTAHDAFGYFGRAYDIEVRGLQGISTVSEFGLADISGLVTMIADRKIKAVFIESSVPRRSIEAVVEGVKSKGHNVTIGGTLYSDAMGTAGTSEGTYIGMVTANVRSIVGALK